MSLTAAPATTSSRSLGFWTAVAIVMGNMIGSGVFLLPASLAPFGGLGLGGWLLSTTGAVLLALVFARLARFNPAAGGPYAFTRQAYGDLAGFLIAWGYWISMWCANAAIAVAFVGYLDPFFPTMVRHPATAAIVASGAIWLLTGVNCMGVKSAGRVQLVTTMLKVLPLVLVGIGGMLYVDPSHFAVATDGGPRAIASGLTASATLTLWAFLGLECATVPADSIRDPQRTIPRATVTGTLLASFVYIVGTIGVIGLLEPSTLGQSTAPFADAARVLAGSRAADLVALGAAISCFGALNGWILVVGQVPMAAAQDGLFPAVFARRSGRAGAPAHAMIIASALTTGLIGMNYSKSLVDLFTFVILLATLSTLVPYAFCSLAGFLLARRDPQMRMTAGAATVGIVAFAYSLWAIGGAGADVVYWGFLLLMAGLPVYVWIRRA